MNKFNVGVCESINLKIKKENKIFILKKLNNKLNFDAIIISPTTYLDYQKINQSPQLKIIFLMSLHLISKIKLNKIKKNIKIIYFDKKNNFKILSKINTTPEFIFGLILLLIKNFLHIQNSVFKNNWKPKETAFHSSRKMLSDATLGIVGYGRIGKKLNLISRSFNLKTIIYSKKQKSLNELAKKSDIVSINLSLNKKTKNLIDKNFFKKMKNGSYFINTSKGQIVNYNHLLKFLGKNIKGAAIDVFRFEDSKSPEIKKLSNFAKKYQNLILTPHIAGSTEDSIIQLQEQVMHILKKKLNNI